MKNCLLIVDPQNDFVNKNGNLYVNNAEKAIDNICDFIEEHGSEISTILISVDNHSRLHVSNSAAWKEHPAVGTEIKIEDLVNRRYNHVIDVWRGDYDETGNLSPLMNSCYETPITIWPEHCITGSWGAALPNKLIDTLGDWQEKEKSDKVIFIPKGNDVYIEEYSIFSGRNKNFSYLLNEASERLFNKIYVCGFCKDICVANTIVDLLIHWDNFEDSHSCYTEKDLIPLDDCMAVLDPNSPRLSVYDKFKK